MLWRERRDVLFAPAPHERELVLSMLDAAGECVVLIDEAHVWMNARSAADCALVELMRVHRHRKLSLFLTSQHLTGDVPQSAFSCAPTLHIFRCESKPVLDRVETEWGLPREQVRNLPQFQYLERQLGFDT